MVSIPCSYSIAARLPRISFYGETHLPFLFPQTRVPKRRYISGRVTAAGPSSSSAGPLDGRPLPRTLFPGGFKRPEISIPSLVLRVSAEEVLGGDGFCSEVDAAVSRGVGIVVLDFGEPRGGGRIYEAACLLKTVLEDRAHLLIAERVDVAAAVGASGIVLSDHGIPAIVARNMMSKSKSDTVFLPIVARAVHNTLSAEHAANCDGADFLILNNESDNKVMLEESFTQHVKVPILFSPQSPGDSLSVDLVPQLLKSGASGIVMSLDNFKLFNDDLLKMFSTNVIAGFTNLDEKEINLLEAESHLLQEAVATIQKAAPMMNEIALLVDASSRLKEPFLMVIVGEFNSGKSTVINALLGRKYLKDGVVPTTNEITLLCYSEADSTKQEQCKRNPDGQFVCYLSAPILKNMNLVDTPGTNVILQRQQRLTEEFIPRADLILFVISSDRPLTESEVTFLRYVQQWKKKVVFVLNKLDLYQNASELEEATGFVKENAQKLLNTGDVRLYPVSSRSALEAKLSALNSNVQNNEEILSSDPRWLTSKFYELEQFLFSFLDGSSDTGMERMKLKLETPIVIAERLIDSCERLVKQQHGDACRDLISIKEVVNSVNVLAMKMENESLSWKKKALSMIETAKDQAVKLTEFTLQLSNIDLIATYAFKREKSASIPATTTLQDKIIGPSISDIQMLLGEYSMWLHSSTAHEGELCVQFLQRQSNELLNSGDSIQSNASLPEEEEELSKNVMEKFSANAAAKLYEQEIREVVLGTFGGLGAAGLSASLLTSVLPTTLEDLLALAFCSAGGFLAISTFPARRKVAVEKVRRVADGLAREVEEAMQQDLFQSIRRLNNFVEFSSKPYQDAARQRISHLQEIQADLATFRQKLEDLKVEIQNLHLVP
ncbi:hypothetical protein AXF42_Ash012207 [Apostasia shenzhenica]|uniref:G domain-containing protein n=1 Tax=Apostasia shenzhenica TaxID=1088818 RepID=A0A2I0B4A8_9ASPA|nr:hypothetical protein AXF42_Ash012207 [Apostasia shenzhenica]